jgi:hypothetical protein
MFDCFQCRTLLAELQEKKFKKPMEPIPAPDGALRGTLPLEAQAGPEEGLTIQLRQGVVETLDVFGQEIRGAEEGRVLPV